MCETNVGLKIKIKIKKAFFFFFFFLLLLLLFIVCYVVIFFFFLFVCFVLFICFFWCCYCCCCCSWYKIWLVSRYRCRNRVKKTTFFFEVTHTMSIHSPFPFNNFFCVALFQYLFWQLFILLHLTQKFFSSSTAINLKHFWLYYIFVCCY